MRSARAAVAPAPPSHALAPRSAVRPAFLVPPTRYVYETPAGYRSDAKAALTSPFPSFWYFHAGAGLHGHVLARWWRQASHRTACVLAITARQLPLRVMDDNDPEKRRVRDRARRKSGLGLGGESGSEDED